MKISFKILSALFLLFLISANIALAQKNSLAAEPALLNVDYEFIHIHDTSNRDQPKKLKVRLYVGQGSSLYLNQTMAEAMENMEARMKELNVGSANTPTTVRVNFRSNNTPGSEELIHYPATQKLIRVDQLGSAVYQIEEDYPAMSWNITEEVKEIGGYHVQQAKATFKGRTYSAWFAPEIPLPYGPWKFSGLPGLILEVTDEEQEVQFLFKNLGQLEKDFLTIRVPEEAIKSSPAQFARAKEAEKENPSISFSGSGGGGTGIATSVVVTKSADGSSRVFTGDDAQAELARMRLKRAAENNNPIERETKKK
jgi:GLPGLI family protein